MKRIVKVLAVAVVMTALIVAMVAPAFARQANPNVAGPTTGDAAASAQGDNATSRGPVTPPLGNPF